MVKIHPAKAGIGLQNPWILGLSIRRSIEPHAACWRLPKALAVYQACFAQQRIAVRAKHSDEVSCLRFRDSGVLGKVNCKPVLCNPA